MVNFQGFYKKAFDKVFIVVDTKHESVIEKFIPDWWGIYVAYYEKNRMAYLSKRKDWL